MKELRNMVSQDELRQRLEADTTPRTTLSFYRYTPIADPQAFRDALYANFEALGALGRIYVAQEGINAQMSVPTANFEKFKKYLNSFDFLQKLRLNIAIEDDGKSFWVLHVRVRAKIVADGINDPTFSMERKGRYLNADQFNQIAQKDDTVIVDMRNYYEYEVGHFENAREVSSDTFKEQLPMAVELLENERDKNIVMYCTGGIRCEKASAYLLHHGFKNVFHLEGGIIEYVREVKEQGLENKFRGKNFVFDNRLAEQVSEQIISHCHQCGELSDTHRNCENPTCHLLFIQCDKCNATFSGCCSEECQSRKHLTAEEQRPLGPVRNQQADFNNSQNRRARAFDLKDR